MNDTCNWYSISRVVCKRIDIDLIFAIVDCEMIRVTMRYLI